MCLGGVGGARKGELVMVELRCGGEGVAPASMGVRPFIAAKERDETRRPSAGFSPTRQSGSGRVVVVGGGALGVAAGGTRCASVAWHGAAIFLQSFKLSSKNSKYKSLRPNYRLQLL